MFGLVVVCAIALTWTPTASAATISVISGNGSIGSTDPNVTVTDSCAGTTTQATIVPPYSDSGGYWIDPIGNSQWDSVNAGSHGCNGTYQATFTLPADAASPSLTVTELADNSTNVSVNGNQPFITGNVPGQCVNAYDGPPVSGTTTSGLVPGVNTLTFNVDNCYPADGVNPTGVDFVATVTYDTAGGSGSGPTGGSSPPTITVDHNPQSLSPTEEEVSGRVNGCFGDHMGQPPVFFTQYATYSNPQQLANFNPPQGPLISYYPTGGGMWCPNQGDGQGIGGVINGLVPGTGYVYRFAAGTGSLNDLITSDTWIFQTPGAPQGIPSNTKPFDWILAGASAIAAGISCTAGEVVVVLGQVACGLDITATGGEVALGLDPPDPNYRKLFKPQVLTTPSVTELERRCKRVLHKGCAGIAKAAHSYLSSLVQLDSVSEALAITADRFSSASRAHNRRAEKSQHKLALRLVKKQRAAARHFLSAAHRFGRVIQGTSLDAVITPTQFAAIRQRIVSGQSIPSSAFRRLKHEHLAESPAQLGGLLGFVLPSSIPRNTRQSELLLAMSA